MLVGAAERDTPQYALVYRSVEHRTLRSLCDQVGKPTPPVPIVCPSSNDLRRFERFRNEGSGSSGLKFKRLSVDGASVGLRWLLA